MKKYLSLFLIVVMLLAIGTPYGAVAEEESKNEGSRDHEHTYSSVNQVVDGWIYHTCSVHVQRIKNTGTCTTCGQTNTWYTKGNLSIQESHNKTLYSSSCDGVMITKIYDCTECGRYQCKSHCPAGPHTGLCPYLPV